MRTQIRIRLFFAGCLCFGCMAGHAQDVPKGLELTEIVNIAETYRQTPSLSFNVLYQYADSADQNDPLETMYGTYKIQNGKYWAMIDSTLIVQGNNYNVSVFYNDSVISIADPQQYTNLMQLPFLDSLFQAQNVDSIRVILSNDSARILRMYFNARSQYTNCQILYDPNSYLLQSMTYCMKTQSTAPTASSTAVNIARVSVSFSNYSYQPVDDSYFREDTFIYKQNGQFFTQAPYANFQVMVNTSN
jgi:hypothetical protein